MHRNQKLKFSGVSFKAIDVENTLAAYFGEQSIIEDQFMIDVQVLPYDCPEDQVNVIRTMSNQMNIVTNEFKNEWPSKAIWVLNNLPPHFLYNRIYKPHKYKSGCIAFNDETLQMSEVNAQFESHLGFYRNYFGTQSFTKNRWNDQFFGVVGLATAYPELKDDLVEFFRDIEDCSRFLTIKQRHFQDIQEVILEMFLMVLHCQPTEVTFIRVFLKFLSRFAYPNPTKVRWNDTMHYMYMCYHLEKYIGDQTFWNPIKDGLTKVRKRKE